MAASGRRPEGRGGETEKCFCCSLSWPNLTEVKGRSQLVRGGGHLGTETLHSRVSWICSAILWSSSPRCPLFTLQSATGFPIKLSSLLSSPEDSHPTQFGTVHPTWPPTLEGPQCHKSSGWEAFDLVYVGNADLGSNARHLPTPQQSAASAVGSDAQIPNVFERNKYCCVTVVIQMLGIE